tara:strand:+ start:535 stop:753 length:219 start_codon:yes stop_codon:yes gene_type:complete
MDKVFQQVTIIISSDDLGGDHAVPPVDILASVVRESPDVDLVSIEEIKDMQLTAQSSTGSFRSTNWNDVAVR